jgi:glycosyltransferase involved in cell wall biosynthesis
MKILMVNAFDIFGGAARAAYRLHTALLNENIDSRMLVQKKIGNDDTVVTETGKIQKLINRLRPILDTLPTKIYKDKDETKFSISWLPSSSIIEIINSINPDIVHLHSINEGMIRIEDLAKIKAPLVWSLHDNWAFTGGCHIMWDCVKYKNSCGFCPRLGSTKEADLSKKIFYRKEKTYSKLQNVTIVGLSSWLQGCAEESALFKNRNIINLPNPIDTDMFKPFDVGVARDLLRISKEKKLVLFGAVNPTGNINKGFRLLSSALSKIEGDDIEFVIFGNSKPHDRPILNHKSHYIGHLHDHISLQVLYNAVDVLVVPSLQENLSNSIMESLSCGTPVVAFNIGGNSDMVEHLKNGYLAKPYDTSDLSHGIEWVLNNKNYAQLCKDARSKVLSEFESKVVVNRYIDLYKEILND